ncbi:MAG: hypothetical protein KGL00_01555 [Gammaproteobacteria bacterium]|nr:hypothetical protein [Gammaproteobacteria bacterium]MDE2272859.1 hypothetical protein [Gammaproteobacteria bacterium]
MKAYLMISGAIFGLFALWHVFELLTHWRTLESDKWFTISTSAVIVLSGVLSVWAWILLKLHKRAAARSTGDGAMLQ